MLVVGPNLSVDQTVGVPRLRVGEIHRVPTIVKLAGGKGANAARAMRILGAAPLLIGFAGGPIGEQLAAYLRADGIAHHLVPTSAETRVCFSIADAATDQQTEFYEAGAGVTQEEVRELLAAVEMRVRAGEWVVLTGSLPRGAPEDLYARCIDIAHRAGAHVILDARGAALTAGLRAVPDLVKVNRGELAECASRTLESVEQVAEAAAALGTSMGAIITLGGEGAVVVGERRRSLVRPPGIAVVSPVGSGDAAAAGIAVGLTEGRDLAEAGRMGVAAGTANALHLGAARFTREEYTRVLAGCTITDLPTRAADA